MFPLIIAAIVLAVAAGQKKPTVASSTSTSGSGLKVPPELLPCFAGITDPEVARALLEILTRPDLTPAQLLQVAKAYADHGQVPAAQCVGRAAQRRALTQSKGLGIH